MAASCPAGPDCQGTGLCVAGSKRFARFRVGCVSPCWRPVLTRLMLEGWSAAAVRHELPLAFYIQY